MTQPPDKLIERLSARLAQPLPGRPAQARFATELSYGRHSGPPPWDARPAAVVALLCWDGGQWYIPLTLRPDHLPDHAGQVCLPGGMTDANESSQQSALRELEEELGVKGEQVRIVGTLSPLYVFASNFWVTPFVGVAKGPVQCAANPHEVAEVVILPVSVLLDAANYGSHPVRRRAMVLRAPHIRCGRHRIWGATSMILGELITIVQQVQAE